MKKWLKPMVLMVLVVFAAACASDQKPAEEAIKAAEAAIDSAKGEAVKYIPDQVKGLEDGLKAAKDALAKKDYKAVLSAAKDLPGKAKDLAAAAAAKKDRVDQNLGGNERWSSQDGRGHQKQGRCPLEKQEASRQYRQGEV